jgi:hypothetical protein
MKQRILGAVLASAALTSAFPARADIVIDWADFANRINNKVEQRTPVSVAANPQVALAMFEAANAVDHRYQSYLGIDPAPAGASEEAAVMAAAHAVLVACYPDQKKMIDENYAVAIEQVPNDAARAKGIAIGESAAAKVMTHGVLDKSIVQQQFRPATSPGTWIGAQLPVFDPWFQALQPFAIGTVDALRPTAAAGAELRALRKGFRGGKTARPKGFGRSHRAPVTHSPISNHARLDADASEDLRPSRTQHRAERSDVRSCRDDRV